MDSPLDLYMDFIDDLLTWPRTSVAARHVREWRDGTPKTYELSPEFNELMAQFPSERRHVIANMLQESHESGMFAVLAYLTDEINLRGLRLSRDGNTFPIEPFGSTLYEDWIRRRDGRSWPALTEDGYIYPDDKSRTDGSSADSSSS
jgi:hypothetical protein